MKKLSIEVKTEYAIEVDFADFCKAFILAADEGTCGYGNAFERFDLTDTTIGNISKAWDSLGTHFDNADTLRFIAHRYLGFWGVVNYGFMQKKNGKKVWRMSVYNEGNDI